MDQEKYLILLKGVDQTYNIQSCVYNRQTQRYDVTFSSGKTYGYHRDAIEWLKKPTLLNGELYRLEKDGKRLGRVGTIWEFSGSDVFWHVVYASGYQYTYRKRELTIHKSCLDQKNAGNRLAYLKDLAQISELKSEDGTCLLKKYYDQLNFVGSETVLANYLEPKTNPVKLRETGPLIFPFGGNASQFQAVEKAMCSQLSVIQGPPGTGKTQTILNIIANLLIRNQTVQVVSNNNSATENVLEKLARPNIGLDFLVATLGRRENKQHFIQTQTGLYPDLSKWRVDPRSMEELETRIASRCEALSSAFGKQERLACAKQELQAIALESEYFSQYYRDQKLKKPYRQPRKSLNSATILRLLRSCESFSEGGRKLSLWFKLQTVFVYGTFEWGFLNQDSNTLIAYLQSLFYVTKTNELTKEIHKLQRELDAFDAQRKMDELRAWSMVYLRGALYQRLGNLGLRQSFSEEDLWKKPEAILQEYPIVLSTTFSSRSSLKGITYDYVIMDEASQVDIATGALALSCAKNAVIVGDLMQLPNVVPEAVQQKGTEIFQAYHIPKGYCFANSFLKSVCTVLPDAPQTLLREHYRCHPQIIQFCNQKFYQNQLIIMTEDQGRQNALSVYRTVAGNHHRGHTNQRQVDVTLEEVLPALRDIPPQEIGVIAPYRDQVEVLASAMPNPKIEVDTVHKFQGREKKAVVLMTVDDRVTDFSDNPYLLNVAVSRAKDRLCLVTSGNDQPEDSNIQDLIAYIQYHNFQIMDSNIYSVFDLLYGQYTQQRVEFLKGHQRISQYDSENLMYGALSDLLRELPELCLKVICHQPVRMLLRNLDLLTEEERSYAANPNTHVDFLIYNAISKAPVLAIEVDGVRFHREGTRQAERDKMKNRIFEKYGIPLLRLSTDGSREMAKVRRTLLGGGK